MSEDNIPLHRPFPNRDLGEVDTTQHSPFSILALAALSSPINPAEIPWARKKLVWFSMRLSYGEITTRMGFAAKPSSQAISSAWTSGAIWNTKDFPIGRFSKTTFLSMKAFNSFCCSGNSRKRGKLSLCWRPHFPPSRICICLHSHIPRIPHFWGSVTFALIGWNSHGAMTSWTRLWTKAIGRGKE